LRSTAGARLPARIGRGRPRLAHGRADRGRRGRRARERDRRVRAGRSPTRDAAGHRLGPVARAPGRTPGARARRDGSSRRTVRPPRMTVVTSDVLPAPTASAVRRVLMIAGEASGDLHGADLLEALRARLPRLEVFGIGGAGLRAAGMQTLVDA